VFVQRFHKRLEQYFIRNHVTVQKHDQRTTSAPYAEISRGRRPEWRLGQEPDGRRSRSCNDPSQVLLAAIVADSDFECPSRYGLITQSRQALL
jgi:hypothetical protein